MKKTKVTVACCALIAPLAFCASAFAGPSENVVQPATQQSAQRTVKKVCYVVRGTSAIPQPLVKVKHGTDTNDFDFALSDLQPYAAHILAHIRAHAERATVEEESPNA